MKLFKSLNFWVVSTILLLIGYAISCTKTDQVLDSGATSTNELLSLKTSTAPSIDGSIDASWEKATKLNFTATVPDPGNNLFSGYINEGYKGTLRSMYDNDYIYFLAEIVDPEKISKIAALGILIPPQGSGLKEPTARTFNSSGVLTREGWGEDKLAFLWNIDNSTAKFNSQTCYASCHVFTPYVDYSVTPAVPKSNASSGNHYTNGVNEKLDQWWLHPNRGFFFDNMDDNYQDWAGGPAVTNLVGGSGNGRHFDDLVVSGASTTWPFAPSYTSDATQGSFNNRQNLKLDDTGSVVTVPLWVVPNESNYDFIKGTDTLSGGRAVKITSVSSTGVLTYAGGTIDPSVGTDYQRIGTFGPVELGQKVFLG
ncbi:MAG: hypothetical protein IPI90_03065 [Saprospiraceae bacterium]|nr:hypothetical protein [Candidatus Vicinibacter affinis]